MVMKLILREKLIREVKGTEEFRYDKEFIASIMKPGKITLVRFTDETGQGSDTILFGTNFSGYRYAHTPMGIYGYSLNNPEILENLRLQKLYFQNADAIVVYWIDAGTNFNLSKDMTQPKFKELVDKIKELKGEEFIATALEKAKEKETKRIYSIDSWRPIRNIFNSLNLDTITDPVEMSKVFWNIVTLGSKSSKEMTLLLFKLGFKSIEDQSAIIDIAGGPNAKSQAPSQTLTLNRSFIDGYKIYTNPGKTIKSTRPKQTTYKQKHPAKLEAESIKRFMQGMEDYKKQLPMLGSVIDDRMKVEHVSGRKFKATLRMPTTIRSSPRFKKASDPKGSAEYNLKQDILSTDGRKLGTSYSGVDFTNFNLILTPRKPDQLEIEFYIDPGVIDKYRPHQFLGFMYKLLRRPENSLTNPKEYLYMVV